MSDLKDILKAIIIDNKMEDEWRKTMILPDMQEAFLKDANKIEKK